VFPRDDGHGPRDIDYAWTIARKAAGITDFHFHDLRHTFASYMAMAGASLWEIADVLGHAKIQQTMAYSHLIEGHTTAAVQRMIAKFLAPPSGQEDTMHERFRPCPSAPGGPR
jgi:integrase